MENKKDSLAATEELSIIMAELSTRFRVSVADAEAAYALVHQGACEDPECRFDERVEQVVRQRIGQLVDELRRLQRVGPTAPPKAQWLGWVRAVNELTAKHRDLFGTMEALGGEVPLFVALIFMRAQDTNGEPDAKMAA